MFDEVIFIPFIMQISGEGPEIDFMLKQTRKSLNTRATGKNVNSFSILQLHFLDMCMGSRLAHSPSVFKFCFELDFKDCIWVLFFRQE